MQLYTIIIRNSNNNNSINDTPDDNIDNSKTSSNESRCNYAILQFEVIACPSIVASFYHYYHD